MRERKRYDQFGNDLLANRPHQQSKLDEIPEYLKLKSDLRTLVEDMKNDCAEGQIRIATTHWRRRIEKLLEG